MTYFEPALPFLLVVGLIGVTRAWFARGQTRRPWLETISLVGICILSTEGGAWLFSRPLEARYPTGEFPSADAQIMVVLAGTVNPPTRARPYALPAPDTYRRIEHAAWLFRYWKAIPILTCGGGSTDSPPFADTMKRILESDGIPSDMIWTERRSTNTYESALFGAELLRQRGVSRIVLVTDATSMPRAAAAFEKQGLTVVPGLVRRNHLTREINDYIPGWRGIQQNSETLHEAVGLIWYKLHGWI
jgi:uncharacterized SAM-binding protein YcdF (DUF218 family)